MHADIPVKPDSLNRYSMRPSVRPRWHLFYFALAGFELLTVFWSLYLSHALMDLYGQSVRVNQEWATRADLFSELWPLAVEVNAPGNDVFESGDVEGESNRLERAILHFDEKIRQVRESMKQSLDATTASRFTQGLERVRTVMDGLAQEARKIMASFRENQIEQAGAYMASTDRKCADAIVRLAKLRKIITSMQTRQIEEQQHASAAHRKFDYLIATAIVLMVGGITIYGHKLSISVRAASHEIDRQMTAVSESDARTRSIVDNAVDGIITIDDHGLVESVNSAAEVLFGYAASEIIGCNVNRLMPSPIRQEHDRYLGRYRETGVRTIVGSQREVEGLRKDGTRFSLELSVSEVQLRYRRLFTGILRDITKRKKTEEQLRIHARQHAALADLGQAALEFRDLDTLLNRVVTLLSEKLGVEYALVMEFMPDEGSLLMRAGFGWQKGTEAKCVTTTEMETQTGYTLHSEGPVIVNHLDRDSRFRGPPFLIDHDVVSGMSVVIPGSNEPFGILGFYSRRQRSFTEDDSYFLDTIAHILATAVRRDRMEQALRIRTTAMEAAVDAIVVTNRKGVIEYVNPAFCTTTGYASEEVIGQSTSKLRSGKHDHDFYKSLWETILAGETWHGEMINRHKDGSLYPEDMTISPVKDANGQVLRFIAIKRDTTERKRIEHELAEYTTAINLHNLELQDANSSLEEARQNAVRAHTELQSAQQELVRSSRKAGMAEVATGVLHNVGNVLNSVNVSASLVADMIRQSKVTSFGKAVDMMNENLDQLGLFITEDERGKRLPGYFTKLAKLLSDEQAAVLEELKGLVENIEHIKQVIRRQQSYSKQSELTETLEVTDVLEEAIKITTDMLDGLGIELLREYSDVPLLTVDRHRLLEILVNLIGNARHAVKGIDCDGQLTLRTQATEDHQIRIEVADNGIGIPQEDLTRIFAHGFSTKKDGHGFGLHSSALAARQMGGSLSAHSDGSGKGATFTLVLPLEKVEAIP